MRNGKENAPMRNRQRSSSFADASKQDLTSSANYQGRRMAYKNELRFILVKTLSAVKM